MEFAAADLGKLHILRVDPGEDVLEAIQEFLEQAGVRQAVVLGGYGTLGAYRLHWVTHNHLPSEILLGSDTGGFEILAMNGLVVEGKAHVHVTLATAGGAFGGHLEPGCIAYVLCELYLAEVEGITLTRPRVAVSVEGMGSGEISRLAFGQGRPQAGPTERSES
ncbi:MAG TPA: PPC domain-containing DNA-binding protein [Anaerolineae bacterium]|nr:PPC domain-containing DNA-binding protein [Anaerolineae bacterium]